MKVSEIINEGVGRITPQNQTQDVGPDQVSIEAKKLGFKVDRDGRPPLLSPNAKKNTKPNTLFNLGIN